MLLSVVMSVYNGEQYLAEAISSVLTQSFREYEFIIIDDGSEDDSLHIINSFNDSRIKLISQKNSGLSVALNRGVKAAKGTYIARMDADDICLPGRFKSQLAKLKERDSLVLVGSNATLIEEGGEIIGGTQLPESDRDIRGTFPGNPYYHSTVIYKKETFLKCGGYNEEIRHHFEDLLLWQCMAKHGELLNMEEPLLKYRLVPGSISNITGKEKNYIAHISQKISSNQKLAAEDYTALDHLSKQKSEKTKNYLYHKLLGKRYLWFNVDKQKARLNLNKAIEYNHKSLVCYLLLAISLLPQSAIIFLYKKYINLKG